MNQETNQKSFLLVSHDSVIEICITSLSVCRLNSPILPLMWWGIKDLIGGKPKTGKVLTIWSPHLCASTKCTITAVIFDAIDTFLLKRLVKLYRIPLQNTQYSTAQIQDLCSLSFIAVRLGEAEFA